MKIILFGPQGSGKGTQAKISSKKLDIPHISTGHIFRQNIKERTKLGKKIEELINSGQMAPDELTNEVVKERLEKKDCQGGFILDGFPRNIHQAEFLETVAKIDLAIEIWISDEEAIKRIGQRRVCSDCGAGYHLIHIPPKVKGICDKCGGKLKTRDDDKENAVKKRLKTYHEETELLRKYYQNKNIYQKANGMKSIEEVNKEVSDIIKNID